MGQSSTTEPHRPGPNDWHLYIADANPKTVDRVLIVQIESSSCEIFSEKKYLM